MITFGLLFLQPKFGAKIIDIVSGDIETPEQKAEGLRAVNSTILQIFLVVVVGYGWWCYPWLFYSYLIRLLPRYTTCLILLPCHIIDRYCHNALVVWL